MGVANVTLFREHSDATDRNSRVQYLLHEFSAGETFGPHRQRQRSEEEQKSETPAKNQAQKLEKEEPAATETLSRHCMKMKA